MTALSADAQVTYKGNRAKRIRSFKMADNQKVYKGSLVSLTTSTGYVQASADTSGTEFVGIAEEQVDNTLAGHTAGGKSIRVVSDVTVLVNLASAAQANVGGIAEVADSATIFAAGGATNHIKVGRIEGIVGTTQAWVNIPPGGYVT